jgi:O-methyltransferase
MKHSSAPLAFDYSECFEDVKKTFAQYANVQIIRGTVPMTLPQVESNRIAYLSTDMNCAEPEIAAAEFFWGKIIAGGVLVLDDYCYSEPYRLQYKPFNDFAKTRNVEVIALPIGQGLVFKPYNQ